MNSRKGQAFSADLAVTVFVFMLVFTFVIFVWYDYNSKLVDNIDYNDMLYTAMQASNGLVKSQGYPWNWTETNVEVIGLIDTDRSISSDKLARFVNLSYPDLRDKLKTGPYDFYFNLEKTDGENYTVGMFPVGENSVRMERYVKYDGEKAKIQIILWK